MKYSWFHMTFVPIGILGCDAIRRQFFLNGNDLNSWSDLDIYSQGVQWTKRYELWWGKAYQLIFSVIKPI